MQYAKFVSTIQSNVLLLSPRWLPKLSPQPKTIIWTLKRVVVTNYMSIPFHIYFIGFLLSWVNMAAVLIAVLGYHLETPGSIITWTKDHTVPPASHHGDTSSFSSPDDVRYMLNKVVLRHVFSKYYVFTLSVEFYQFSVFVHLFISHQWLSS